MELKRTPTPQERLEELYHDQSPFMADIVRFNEAVKKYEECHGVTSPFASYNGFKNYQTKLRRKKTNC